MIHTIQVVFDGPPGPQAPRFIEVEDAHGRSLKVGEWQERKDGTWALVLKAGIERDQVVPEPAGDEP